MIQSFSTNEIYNLTHKSVTFFKVTDKVSDTRAWRWRIQLVAVTSSISFLTRGSKLDQFQNKTGAPSIQIYYVDMITCDRILLILKSFSSDWKYPLQLSLFWVIYINRNSSSLAFPFTQWTKVISWLQLLTSVDSSNWIEILAEEALISKTTWSRISVPISPILLWITLFDRGICCGFCSTF